jgi:hypothetical protein
MTCPVVAAIPGLARKNARVTEFIGVAAPLQWGMVFVVLEHEGEPFEERASRDLAFLFSPF